MIDSSARAQFDLTDDQRQIAALAAEIAQREIAPHIARWDRDHVFPRELFTKLNGAGIMGILVPEAYGGVGAEYVSYALAIEELARVDAGTAVTLSVHSMICVGDCAPRHRGAKRAAGCRKLATGDVIAGFALTEPDAGSDAAAIRATAKRDGGGYVLNGRKQWCTNGSFAGVMMGDVPHRRRRRARRQRVSRRATPARHRGREASPKNSESTPATRAISLSTTCACRRDALLGDEGAGFGIGDERHWPAAASASPRRRSAFSQRASIDSVAFAKERVAFGKPIGAFEGISFKIAQMAMDLDAARLLIYRAAALADAGGPSRSRRAKPNSSPRPRRASTPPKRCRFTAATVTRPNFRSSATTATPRSPRSTKAPRRSSRSSSHDPYSAN